MRDLQQPPCCATSFQNLTSSKSITSVSHRIGHLRRSSASGVDSMWSVLPLGCQWPRGLKLSVRKPMPSTLLDDNPTEPGGTSPESTLLTTTKFWQLLGISQPDHDTYLAVIHVRRQSESREQEKASGCI